MRPGRPEPHILAGAYAADALDDPDRARFERHLARCPECAREIGGLHEAAARLAAAAAAQPRFALKERVLAETARTRQLPPATRGSPAPPAWHLGPRRRTGSRRAPNRRRAWAARPALVLAGIFLLASAAGWGVGQAFPAQPPPVQSPHAIAAVLTAPDATVISARVRTGGTATVVMSGRERMLVFAAAGLRALPSSRCYELWLMGPGPDRPAGLLPMARHGMTGPVIASGLRSGDELGLTVEPATGSRHPTSAMILVLAL
jgi:anti-sigma-K factor RskA